MRVLVTGAAGAVAPGVVRALARAFELRLLDLARSEKLGEYDWAVGSILDVGFLRKALEGVEAVVNLAIVRKDPGRDVTTDRFFDVNVKGLYLLLEAAAEAGTGRFVHMGSTAPVIGHWDQGEKITVKSSYTTRGRYSLTKALQEAVCEHMAKNSEMRIVVLRPWVPCEGITTEDEAGREVTRDYHPGLIDTEDLGEACRLAVQAADLARFEVFHTVATREARERFDAGRTEKVLGFRPKEDFHDLAAAGDR